MTPTRTTNSVSAAAPYWERTSLDIPGHPHRHHQHQKPTASTVSLPSVKLERSKGLRLQPKRPSRRVKSIDSQTPIADVTDSDDDEAFSMEADLSDCETRPTRLSIHALKKKRKGSDIRLRRDSDSDLDPYQSAPEAY